MRSTSLLLTFFLAVPLAAQGTPQARPVAPVAPLARALDRSVWSSYNDLADRYLDMTDAFTDLSYNFDTAWNSTLDSYSLGNGWSDFAFASAGPPSPWAQGDPADSLYRSARDQLNRGDYRRAAALFKQLPEKYPASAYATDALYWQAYALYRIGGTPELQEGLTVLAAAKTKAAADSAARTDARPLARSMARSDAIGSRVNLNLAMTMSFRGGRNDIDALAARIANVLSQRGFANDPAVRKALAAAGNSCDAEDQSVRTEALSALMQSDPDAARQLATKILAKTDECSVPLRRNAVFIVGNKHDDAAVNALIPVAKNDPSLDVRASAIDYLAQVSSPAALAALRDLAMLNSTHALEASSDSGQVQRAAIRALASSGNPAAMSALRSVIENTSAPIEIRYTALDGLRRNISEADAAWLRALYPKVTDARLKQGIVMVVSTAGGSANNQWLADLIQNDTEPVEARMSALSRVGRTMDIAALGKLYDGASQRQVRETVISILSSRTEPAAVDKLIEIARNGTDPAMRRSAISALARSKDPRAEKLLLDLVDHQ